MGGGEVEGGKRFQFALYLSARDFTGEATVYVR